MTEGEWPPQWSSPVKEERMKSNYSTERTPIRCATVRSFTLRKPSATVYRLFVKPKAIFIFMLVLTNL